MRAIVLMSVLCVGLARAYPQQAIDPAYLRQYYQQIAQQAGASQSARADSTPIYEQGAQEQHHAPQYVQQAQQIRVKDNVNEQVRQQYVQQAQARQYQQPQQYQQQQQQGQYAPQEPAYQPPRPKASKPRPAQQFQSVAGGQKAQEEEEEYDTNPSYQFGFDVKDDEFTNYQNRKEQREGGVIKGSYSVVDSDGFIRTVTYTADPKEGFKAEVTRTPTDIVVKIPKQQPQHQTSQQAGPQQVRNQPQPQQYQQPSPQPAAGRFAIQQRPRQEYQQYQQ